MGYDLHITRKEDWSDEDSDRNISLAEWLEYINKDTELKISEDYQIKNPQKSDETIPAPGFCDWLNHPQKEEYWFLYNQGNIETKNPDEHAIIKMLSIANNFNAKVQGDDGEVYSIASSSKIIADDGSGKITIINPDKKPWWKFWS